MKFTEVLKKANHNTWNRKLRSVLTILSITVGATTLTLAVALGTGAQNLIQSSLSSSELKNAVIVFKMPQQIAEMRQVEEENQRGVPEYNPDDESQQPQADPGRAVITTDDMAQIDSVMGVETVYPAYQDLVGKTVSVTFINPETERTSVKSLPVLGVMADVFGSYESIVNYDTIKSVAEELGMQETNVLIAVLSEGYTDEVNMVAVSDLIEGVSPQYSVSSSAEDRGEARTVIKIFRIGLVSFAAIVLLAALFGISNTLLMSVLERTQDIGLMRALGAKKSNIFSMFAMESALIGFWGAVVGILIGMGLGTIGNIIMRRVQPEVFTGEVSLLQFDPLSMLGIIAVLSFVAFLAGTLPARKAAKTNVINALRYE
jgi:putative ABC transport system permease protein